MRSEVAQSSGTSRIGLALPPGCGVGRQQSGLTDLCRKQNVKCVRRSGVRLPPYDPSTSEAELLALIYYLNADNTIDGISAQLPLPAGNDNVKVLERIAPDKDVDGFHPYTVVCASVYRAYVPVHAPRYCDPA